MNEPQFLLDAQKKLFFGAPWPTFESLLFPSNPSLEGCVLQRNILELRGSYKERPLSKFEIKTLSRVTDGDIDFHENTEKQQNQTCPKT